MTFPVFASGDVLNASDMNAVGLWLVKSQTIGTAVSTVTVTDAFSSNFDNYLITVGSGVASTTLDLRLTFGATATGYYWSGFFTTGGWVNGVNGNGGSNLTFMTMGRGTTNALDGYVRVYSPNLAKRTTFETTQITADTGATGRMEMYGGFLNDATQYTAFTLTTSTGTITGGTVRVYGMRN